MNKEENLDSRIVNIRLDQIIVNKNQPRKEFKEESIIELSRSIEENGLIQPIIVRKLDSKYQIVVGERRFRAMKALNREEMPCIVRDIDEIIGDEIALVENIQREDLSPIEEALAFKNILDKYGWTQEELAGKIGKSRSYISNAIRILSLEEDVILFLNEAVISMGHAKALLSLKGERQLKALNIVLDKALSVRETEELVKAMKEEGERPRQEDSYLVELEEQLMMSLGTKVSLRPGKKKSLIEIEYYTEEDLERIMDILN